MIQTNTEILTHIQNLAQNGNPFNLECRRIKAGEYLCEQNRMVRSVMFINHGITRAFHREENTKEFTLCIFGKGEVVGDWEALGKSRYFVNSVVALTDVEVYLLSVENFLKLCDTDFKFCRLMLTELSRQKSTALIRASNQLLNPMKSVLAQLMETMHDQQISLTKSEIASYLGVELRTVNRILKEISHR